MWYAFLWEEGNPRDRHSGAHLTSYWDLWWRVGNGEEAAEGREMTGTC